MTKKLERPLKIAIWRVFLPKTVTQRCLTLPTVPASGPASQCSVPSIKSVSFLLSFLLRRLPSSHGTKGRNNLNLPSLPRPVRAPSHGVRRKPEHGFVGWRRVAAAFRRQMSGGGRAKKDHLASWINLDRNYSLHTHKSSRLGQRHGLQSATLTSYFYKNMY
jgi:hypothetical protein